MGSFVQASACTAGFVHAQSKTHGGCTCVGSGAMGPVVPAQELYREGGSLPLEGGL